jgi:serine protease Do
MVSTLDVEKEIEMPANSAPFLLSEAVSAEMAELAARAWSSVVVVRSAEGRGAGAGVVWRTDGGIVTNAHVVAHSRGPLVVQLSDGRELTAKVVNQNNALDLALLQVEADDLPAAPVADSTSLRVGELVFAVGHPWGQRHTVTAGIVSGLGTIGVPHTGRTAQYVRSDVALGPGNSGGPLLNARGEVIGINAMVFGGDMGVAIPSHVTTQWVAGPPSRKVYLGVGVLPVELPSVAFDFPRSYEGRAAGLLVTGVDQDGPAHRAGLLVGDVVLAAGGESVPDGDTLLHVLGSRSARERIRLHVMRGEGLQEIDVELGELQPESEATES